MLRSLKEITGYALHAQDGILGKVADFYFDERDWSIRYLVADTGSVFTGKKVLISPAGFYDKPDWANKTFNIIMTRDMIKEAPDIDTQKPVSRRKEIEYARYFKWPLYWNPMSGGQAMPAMTAPTVNQPDTECGEEECRLRSMKELTGYHIKAEDGAIGHVEDFIIEDDQYFIRYLVVDTRNWLPGKKVLIAKDWIRRANWEDKTLSLMLNREKIKNSPPFNPNEPVNRGYEGRIYDYYGRPGYWEK